MRLAFVVVLLSLSGCEPVGDKASSPATAPAVIAEGAEPLGIDTVALVEARRVAAELEPALMDRLVVAAASGGTAAALAYCIDSAQALVSRLAADGGRIVRRVSAQSRNPVNAPDSLEALILERMVLALGAGQLTPDTAFMVAEADGRRTLHYARPILMRQQCLACHGEPANFTPRVRDLLARKYPHDRAVNHPLGGLRGIVSVRLEVP